MNNHHFLRVAILGAALSALCVVGASAASLGVGTVDADGGLRLRAEANTSADVLATIPNDSEILVVADNGDGWYQVDYDGAQGFVSGSFLTVNGVWNIDRNVVRGKVNTEGSTLNMRSAPSTSGDKVAALPADAVVDIIGVNNGWYKVKYNGQTGYVSSDYMITTRDQLTSRGDSASAQPEAPAPAVSAPDASLSQQIIDYAKQFLGTPYVYGANGPRSFDCSGFTKYVYAHFGYTLNRSAASQLSNGIKVSFDQLQPGDLVFFKYQTTKAASHVGIYLGGGQFIHASTNEYQVRISSLSGHYANTYVAGRRIL